MREIRSHGSEGGEARVFPTPILLSRQAAKAQLSRLGVEQKLLMKVIGYILGFGRKDKELYSLAWQLTLNFKWTEKASLFFFYNLMLGDIDRTRIMYIPAEIRR